MLINILPSQQSRPWTPLIDTDGDSSEYTYHYAVHSPSTGDVKSAHQSKLPYGGVVGG